MAHWTTCFGPLIIYPTAHLSGRCTTVAYAGIVFFISESTASLPETDNGLIDLSSTWLTDRYVMTVHPRVSHAPARRRPLHLRRFRSSWSLLSACPRLLPFIDYSPAIVSTTSYRQRHRSLLGRHPTKARTKGGLRNPCTCHVCALSPVKGPGGWGEWEAPTPRARPFIRKDHRPGCFCFRDPANGVPGPRCCPGFSSRFLPYPALVREVSDPVSAVI